MRLKVYCDFLYDFLNSRKDLEVEQLLIQLLRSEREASIMGRVRFWNNSLLRFEEEFVERGMMTVKANYVYHYQTADGTLVFRYDNSAHHSEIATFPHHKHVIVSGSETIEPTQTPSLLEALREIENLLYANNE